METTTTTTYHREYSDRELFGGDWFRTSMSLGQGYATPAEAQAEPLMRSDYATRIVAVTTTVTTTVVE